MFRNATAPGPGVNRGSTRRCVRLVAITTRAAAVTLSAIAAMPRCEPARGGVATSARDRWQARPMPAPTRDRTWSAKKAWRRVTMNEAAAVPGEPPLLRPPIRTANQRPPRASPGQTSATIELMCPTQTSEGCHSTMSAREKPTVLSRNAKVESVRCEQRRAQGGHANGEAPGRLPAVTADGDPEGPEREHPAADQPTAMQIRRPQRAAAGSEAIGASRAAPPSGTREAQRSTRAKTAAVECAVFAPS